MPGEREPRSGGGEEEFEALRLEALGRIAGGVAHDFNNLLTIIGGNVELLAAGLPDPAAVQVELDELRRAMQRAGDLARHLLSLSRPQLTTSSQIELNLTLRGLERLLKRVVGERIEVELELDPEEPSLVADPQQVEHVLVVLAVALRQGLSEGGRLTIRTGVRARDGSRRSFVELTAKPEAAGGTDDAPFGGTLIDRLRPVVDELCCDLLVSGRRGGPGTVTLLAAALDETGPSEEARAGGGEAASSTAGHRILVVEDQRMLRRLILRTLEGEGHRVTVAGSGAEALAEAEEAQGFDLLLCDVVLPDAPGPTLHRQLSERFAEQNPRVLFMSGYSADLPEIHGLLAAGTPFLGKPFTPSELRAKVREVLSRPAEEPGGDEPRPPTS